VGTRQHGQAVLAALLVSAVVISAAAGFIASRFVSPAQQAARATAPKPSLILAPVRYGTVRERISLRTKVKRNGQVNVGVPVQISGDSTVVTSVAVDAGQRVGAGQLLGTVDEQPVFVMRGQVPAFRDMQPGTHGVDVAELQRGLIAAGYGIGDDHAGSYGPGTAAAVAGLYSHAHMQANVPSGATARVHAAEATLQRDEHVVQASAQARASVTRAQRELAAARRTAEPTVPDGEVAFVQRLPATVLSVAALGATLGAGGGSSALAQLGSSSVTMVANTTMSEARMLRVGLRAAAFSDSSGLSMRVRIAAIDGAQVKLKPVGAVPRGLVGQTVQVVAVVRQARALIVPVAALATSGSGRVYVTVLDADGHQRNVWVRPGLAADGRQEVNTGAGKLRAGDRVVIGEQAR